MEIPPQSQGVGSIALSQMYRDAAMLEQESLALAAESQKRRLESEMPSAVPKMAKTSVSQTHVSTPATASPAGPQNAGNGGRCFRCGRAGHWSRDCTHIAMAMTARMSSPCHVCGGRTNPPPTASADSASGRTRAGGRTTAALSTISSASALSPRRTRATWRSEPALPSLSVLTPPFQCLPPLSIRARTHSSNTLVHAWAIEDNISCVE